jgi:hypothetical protein
VHFNSSFKVVISLKVINLNFINTQEEEEIKNNKYAKYHILNKKRKKKQGNNIIIYKSLEK